MATPSNSPEAPATMIDKQQRGQKRRVSIAITLFLAAIAIQATASITSYQIANMATAVVGLLALFTLYRWWWCRPENRPVFRFLSLAALITGLIVCAALFELKGVSGELVPEFHFRYAATPTLPVESETNRALPAEAVLTIDARAYPGFLGKDRRGIVEHRRFTLDPQRLTHSLLWKHPLGAGLAGISVAAIETQQSDEEKTTTSHLLFTMEQRGNEEWITCYDAENGELRWHHAYPAFHTHILGDTGPRSTPTIDQEGRVYTQGAAGRVCCLVGVSGQLLWSVDLLEVAGIQQSTAEQAVTWGRAASPLRVDDLVVLPLGGEQTENQTRRTLIALDASTGETRWTSGNHQISYASPVIATLCGVRQILSVDEDFASGTRVDNGEVLWTYPWPGKSNTGANCSNPIAVAENRVLLTKEYGGGALMLQIAEDKGRLLATPLWDSSQLLKTKFTNAVTRGPFAFGLSDGTLECVDIEKGERRWKQTRRQRTGHGHVLLVEDCLVYSGEQGEITICLATANAYEEIYRFSALSGKTWNPFAIVDNRLYVRNGEEIAAWELTPMR